MGNPNQFDWGGEDLVVKSITLSDTPGGTQTVVSSGEIAVLDGVTAGTATASKAVVLGASKEIATITTATITTVIPTTIGGTPNFSGAVTMASTLGVTGVATFTVSPVFSAGITTVAVTTLTPTTIAGAANFTGTPTFAAGQTVTGSVTATGSFVGGQVSAGTIADGASVVLTAAQSGSTCVFSTTTGSLFTLPTPVAGMEFYFVVEASLASGAYKFITDSGSVFLKGSVYDVVASTGVQTNFAANGTTIRAASMNATTTGGLIGTWYRLVAKSTTVWEIYGMNYATGTVATPFATS